jgi:hypothetical protein
MHRAPGASGVGWSPITPLLNFFPTPIPAPPLVAMGMTAAALGLDGLHSF